MLPLPVVHPDLLSFATVSWPLRPSKVARLLGCPMSIVLTSDREGGQAAQTGNLVHSAAAAFHQSKGDRVADGLAALQAARDKFPEGDSQEAIKHFTRYSSDKTNSEAETVWIEQPVNLVLPADDSDPTGLPIHINGTLDQVRRAPDGALTVWDIKTGRPEDAVLEYLVQQAVYVMAARASLDPGITPGGLILTKNYFVARAIVHAPLTFGVDQCIILLDAIRVAVADVRRGKRLFHPSPDHCRWCDAKPWPNCTSVYEQRFSV